MLDEVRRHLALATVEPGSDSMASTVLMRLSKALGQPLYGNDIHVQSIDFHVRLAANRQNVELVFPGSRDALHRTVTVSPATISLNFSAFVRSLQAFVDRASGSLHRVQRLAESEAEVARQAAALLLKTVGVNHSTFVEFEDGAVNPDTLELSFYVHS